MRLTEVRINLCAPPPASDRPTRNGHRTPACRNGGGGSRHGGTGGRLRAFCSLTFDDAFVVRDVKLIEGNDGLFLAMPSRKLTDHCPACGDKNHLRARYCNGCGGRLDEDRFLRYRDGNTHCNGNGNGNGNGAGGRIKLHADVAHPINADTRQEVEREVMRSYWREVERSKQPGYVPPSLDGEDFDLYDLRPQRAAVGPAVAGSGAGHSPFRQVGSFH